MQDSQVATATYTISSPSITVTTPNSSTEWEKGDTVSIEWTSTGSVGNVDIDLYKISTFESTIASNTANDGSHSWTIPTSLTSSTLYKIKMWHISDSTYIGESYYFTISDSTPQYGTLKIVNNSVYNIDVVKWKVAGTSTYGADQLTTVLYNGDDQNFVLETGSYDVKVESTSSSVHWEFTNITLNDSQTTTLTCYSKPSLTVVNNSVNPDGTNTIHELYLTTTDGSWGTNYLGSGIYDGDSETISDIDPDYYYMKLWHNTLIGDDVCIYITVGDLDWGENETINVTQNWGTCVD